MSSWKVPPFQKLLSRAFEDRMPEGMTTALIGESLGMARTSIYKAIRTGEGIGWEALTRLVEIFSLDPEERAEMEFAWIEARSKARAEGAAFVKEMSKAAKFMPPEMLTQFRQDVIKSYVSELKKRGLL